MVCSPREAAEMKKRFGTALQVITPGIRLEAGGDPAAASGGYGTDDRWSEATQINDQKRTLTPAEARAAGADLIVVGRPVLKAADPAAAVRNLLEAIR